MPEHRIDIPADQLYDWIRRESEGHFANFHVNAHKEYVVAGADPVGEGAMLERGALDVEPLVEQNYWVLRFEATRRVEPQAGGAAPSPVPDITADEFAAEFLAPDAGAQTKVMVMVQTDEAKRAFDDWLAGLRRKHGAPVTKSGA